MAPTRVLGLVLGFLAPWSGAYVLPFHPSAYMVERGRELKHGGHGGAARLATREFVTDLPELMVDTRLAGWRVKKEREERQPVASDSPVLNDQHPAVIGDVVEYPIPERLRLERGENRERGVGVLASVNTDRRESASLPEPLGQDLCEVQVLTLDSSEESSRHEQRKQVWRPDEIEPNLYVRCGELTKVRSTGTGGPDQRRRYTLDQELSATCGPPEGLDEPLEMP